MARAANNHLLDGLSGRIGNIVIKKYGDKLVVSALPDMSSVKHSELQKVFQGFFKEAHAWARKEMRDPKRKAYWAKKATPGQSAHNAAATAELRRLNAAAKYKPNKK